MQSEAAKYLERNRDRFDVVSCIGATWIGGGLLGTLEQMKSAIIGPECTLLVGEPFWLETPPEEAYAPLSDAKDTFVSLEGTLARIESAGFELIEMVLANHDDWDRYEASQWTTGRERIREHPDDPDLEEVLKRMRANREAYLRWGREALGWAIYVFRKSGHNR